MEGLLSNQTKLAMPQLFLRGFTRISMSAPQCHALSKFHPDSVISHSLRLRRLSWKEIMDCFDR